ncbi:MAG: hypothetical protein H5T69_07535 [Chloroflexi bacterium]|nr:hypothetical protein [Chloroflexota bacterium]
MYASVWNRVVFLASGMAFGWNLVNYWVVPLPEARRHVWRLVLSAIAGWGLAVALGIHSPAAGLSGLLVFGVAALVAYAGNARQKSRVPSDDEAVTVAAPASWRPESCLLLVAPGEPSCYTGPEAWSRRLAEASRRGFRAPGWFLRPLAYSRIRAAYRHLEPFPMPAWMRRVAEQLAQHLGDDWVVEIVIWSTKAEMGRRLAQLAQGGCRHIVLVPLSLHSTIRPLLQEAVNRSRVREIGVFVDVVELETSWFGDDPDARLSRLLVGQPAFDLPSPPVISDEVPLRAQALRALREQVVKQLVVGGRDARGRSL